MKSILLILLLLLFVVSVYPQTSQKISISNFGAVDTHLYRGAQPKRNQYKELKDLGIDTVIDLQDKPKDYEKESVESLGMHYINIPIADKQYPSQEVVNLFLATVKSADSSKIYVHCAGGRHRTGDMIAVYRITKYGWDFDKVYQEMKSYDFYTSWGHGKQKQFVLDYYTSHEAQSKS